MYIFWNDSHHQLSYTQHRVTHCTFFLAVPRASCCGLEHTGNAGSFSQKKQGLHPCSELSVSLGNETHADSMFCNNALRCTCDLISVFMAAPLRAAALRAHPADGHTEALGSHLTSPAYTARKEEPGREPWLQSLCPNPLPTLKGKPAVLTYTFREKPQHSL